MPIPSADTAALSPFASGARDAGGGIAALAAPASPNSSSNTFGDLFSEATAEVAADALPERGAEAIPVPATTTAPIPPPAMAMFVAPPPAQEALEIPVEVPAEAEAASVTEDESGNAQSVPMAPAPSGHATTTRRTVPHAHPRSSAQLPAQAANDSIPALEQTGAPVRTGEAISSVQEPSMKHPVLAAVPTNESRPRQKLPAAPVASAPSITHPPQAPVSHTTSLTVGREALPAAFAPAALTARANTPAAVDPLMNGKTVPTETVSTFEAPAATAENFPGMAASVPQSSSADAAPVVAPHSKRERRQVPPTAAMVRNETAPAAAASSRSASRPLQNAQAPAARVTPTAPVAPVAVPTAPVAAAGREPLVPAKLALSIPVTPGLEPVAGDTDPASQIGSHWSPTAAARPAIASDETIPAEPKSAAAARASAPRHGALDTSLAVPSSAPGKQRPVPTEGVASPRAAMPALPVDSAEQEASPVLVAVTPTFSSRHRPHLSSETAAPNHGLHATPASARQLFAAAPAVGSSTPLVSPEAVRPQPVVQADGSPPAELPVTTRTLTSDTRPPFDGVPRLMPQARESATPEAIPFTAAAPRAPVSAPMPAIANETALAVPGAEPERQATFAAMRLPAGAVSAKEVNPVLKKVLDTKRQTVAEPSSAVGIAAAKPSATMFAPSLSFQPPVDVPEHVAAGVTTPPTLSAPEFPTFGSEIATGARRAVEAVITAVDRFTPRESNSVNLQFSVGGSDLTVRVEMRADTVHTTFRTDSPELRQALAQEWQAVQNLPSDRAARFSDAAFTSQSGAGEGDAAAHQREQHARRTPEPMPSSPRPTANRGSGVSTPAMDVPASRVTPLSTALHLHTFA